MKINAVEEFMALASLNSPSRREAPVAAYLVNRLREMGLSPEVDDSAPRSGSDTGNVIVRVPGNTAGATVLLCAHMDTVGPTEGMVPVLRDGVITSNGETVLGADDKAGIAIILAALSELLLGDTPHGPIEVVFTVQEEVGLFGATYLNAELKADFGYILDGDGPVGNIANQAPSKVDLDFVLEGRAAHAGISPEAGINAIVAAAKAIARLRTGRIDAHTTSNVGVISGGKARNIVPDRAEVAVEVRSTDTAKLEREVQAVLDAFTGEAAGLRRAPRRPAGGALYHLHRHRDAPGGVQCLPRRPLPGDRTPSLDLRRRHGRQRLQRPGACLRGARHRRREGPFAAGADLRRPD